MFACHLYEATMTSRSGYSYLGMVLSASIVEGTLNIVLGRENDKNMREFHIKLEGFIRKYSGERGLRVVEMSRREGDAQYWG